MTPKHPTSKNPPETPTLPRSITTAVTISILALIVTFPVIGEFRPPVTRVETYYIGISFGVLAGYLLPHFMGTVKRIVRGDQP